ncbi:hypothetical protein L798_02148 [Zootermopsis nevadensis]|uniref:Uncharacterized protein n=1 Tax=Zootermopsis nevadensis TaxID=136037 RepID=A0A067RIY5_ZOONE|nr:hypothetical protein L798_02148 [Zootermopsis nevadensis]
MTKTLKEDDALLAALHLNGLVRGLVALQLEGRGALVSHEALFALQHEDWPAEERPSSCRSLPTDAQRVCISSPASWIPYKRTLSINLLRP